MSAWPDVAAHLVTMLEAAGSPTVIYGPPVMADTGGDYATVGYVLDDDDGGSYTVETYLDGSQLLETGVVHCHLVAQSGDTDLEGQRSDVFAVADAFHADVRADHTLGGVLSPDGTATVDVTVRPVQNAAGAAQSLVVSVNYTTRY